MVSNYRSLGRKGALTIPEKTILDRYVNYGNSNEIREVKKLVERVGPRAAARILPITVLPVRPKSIMGPTLPEYLKEVYKAMEEKRTVSKYLNNKMSKQIWDNYKRNVDAQVGIISEMLGGRKNAGDFYVLNRFALEKQLPERVRQFIRERLKGTNVKNLMEETRRELKERDPLKRLRETA